MSAHDRTHRRRSRRAEARSVEIGPTARAAPPPLLPQIGSLVELVSRVVAISSLVWTAWQMIRIGWFPAGAPDETSTRGLTLWASEFFFLFVPLLMVVLLAFEETWARITAGLFLVGWCGASGAAVTWAFSGDRRFVVGYLLTVLMRVGDLVWAGISRGSRAPNVDGLMKRWGIGVGLFLLATFAGLFAPWPEGRALPAAHGRGLFERNPEMVLGAMAVYFTGQTLVSALYLRNAVRAARRASR